MLLGALRMRTSHSRVTYIAEELPPGKAVPLPAIIRLASSRDVNARAMD